MLDVDARRSARKPDTGPPLDLEFIVPVAETIYFSARQVTARR